MKKFNRITAAIMTFALMLTLTGFSVTWAQAASKAKPYELKWYIIGNGTPKDVASVEKAASAYIQKKGLNATIKLQWFDFGSYQDKVGTFIKSRQQFDICFTSSWALNYRQNAAKGAFVDITKLIYQYAPKTAAQLGQDFINGAKIDGKLFAIQTNKEQAHQWGFLVKKDMIDKYKLNVAKIKTLEDLEPLLAKVKENEPDMIPLEALDGESPFKLLDFDRVGDDKYPGVLYNNSKDMKVMNEFTLPETKKLFETMHKYYLAGYIREDAATITDFVPDEQAGKIFVTTKSMKPGKAEEESLMRGYQWVQVNITAPVISNRDTTGSMMAISSTSKNPVLALKFMEMVNTDKYLNNLINFGIEGKHFVKTGANTIKPGPQASVYSPGNSWVYANQFLNYLQKGEDLKKWDKFKSFNKSAKATKSLGFNFDASPVTAEIAACNNVWAKYVPGLETGTLDPAEALPKAIQEFKDAGVDKIIAEKQKQLNAWLKKNKK